MIFFLLLQNACGHKNDNFYIQNTCHYRSDLEVEGLTGKVKSIEEISYVSTENNDTSNYSITFYSVKGFKDSIQYFEKSVLNWVDTYIRDAENKLLRVVRRLRNGENFELNTYEYISCNLVIDKMKYSKSIMHYNSNQLLTEINRQTYYSQDTVNSRVTFFYDGVKLTKWIEVKNNGDSSVAKFNYGFANFSKNEFYKNKKISAGFNYTYTSFDEFENWLTAIKSEFFYYSGTEKFENLIERKINYYPESQ